jgi:organic radical activating enzyme
MACSGKGILTPGQIAAALPYPMPPEGADPMQGARRRMQATGQWHSRQSMGRRWTIGCVALEITQRCNLDCTLCYLSDHSEAVQDIPLQAVFDRIDLIRAHYGPDTDVQVTGGDPTLRKREELVAIIRRVRERGMRPSLFTNGIKATRDLLEELCEAGLVDVAFHVDMTQERKGYTSEAELNAVRAEYLDRTRGLPLSVFFNTTIFDGNFHEIPHVAAFFVRHADAVQVASFQLQADTGRGTLRARLQPIDIDTVSAQLRLGAGTGINFDTPIAGHSECNRYAMTLVANGRVHDLYGESDALATILQATAGIQFDRQHRGRAIMALARGLLRWPGAALRLVPWAVRRVWAMRRDLVAARGRVHKLSFFIHNFMDAEHLACDRIDACVFMVATQGRADLDVPAQREARQLHPEAHTARGRRLLGPADRAGHCRDHRCRRAEPDPQDRARPPPDRDQSCSHRRPPRGTSGRGAMTRRRALLAGAAALVAAPLRAQTAADPAWFDAFEAVLRQRVDARGRVDFVGIAAAPQPLAAVVAEIGASGPENAPGMFPTPAHVLAWRINAYNALAMLGIVRRGIPDQLNFLGRYGFFVNTTVRVAGRDTSLKSFEDDVIRPMDEERIHFALNCMVRGCPRLPREAFRAARLEAQLAAAAQEFCESGYQVRPAPDRQAVFVSQIFQFFTGDFVPAKAPTVLAYINRWRRDPVPAEWTLRFFDYDWTVNRQPGTGGDAG